MAEVPHYPPPRPIREPHDGRHGPTNGRSGERPLGDLFRELADETKLLVRQEIALAKTEASRKARKAGRDVGFAAAGGFVAYAGLIVALIGLGLLLGTVMPDWLGLAIVGVAVVVTGYALLQKGLGGLRNTDFALEHTARTMQEDAAFVRQQAQEIKRDPARLGAQHDHIR